MKIQTGLITGLLILFITACGGKDQLKKQQEKSLEKLAADVMVVHDRSMPEHGKLFKKKKQLLGIHDTTRDSLVKNEIAGLLIRIDKADEDMMHWMHTYEAPEEFLPFEEKKKYYEEQKASIEKVEKEIQSCLETSDTYIKKYSIPAP